MEDNTTSKHNDRIRQRDILNIQLVGRCSLCGYTGRTYRHHLWYSDAEDTSSVIEVCHRCHAKIEGRRHSSRQSKREKSMTICSCEEIHTNGTKAHLRVEHSVNDNIVIKMTGIGGESYDGEPTTVTSVRMAFDKAQIGFIGQQLMNVSEIVTRSEKFQHDIDKGWFQCKQLSLHEVQLLYEAGYEQVVGPVIGRGTANYMIRNDTTNQSDMHFILTRLIADYVESFGLSSAINDSGHNCDVVATNGNGASIGFEIETGANNFKSDVLNKVNRLNANRDQLDLDAWFFVVPSKLRGKYAEVHANTITSGKIGGVLSKFMNMDSRYPDQNNTEE